MAGAVRNRGHRNTNERGGSHDRRRRKLFLLTKFGDGTTAKCHEEECTTMLTYDTIYVDRIIPAHLGGTYRRDNIRPHCRYHSCAQGAKMASELRRLGRHRLAA